MAGDLELHPSPLGSVPWSINRAVAFACSLAAQGCLRGKQREGSGSILRTVKYDANVAHPYSVLISSIFSPTMCLS